MLKGGTAGSEEVGTRKVARNGILAAAQVLCTSIGYLLVFKIIGHEIGIEVLGAWTLCLSLATIATLLDFGVSDGLVRTIAQHVARSHALPTVHILLTGLLFCLLASIAGGILCYFGLAQLIPLVISDASASATSLSFLVPAIVVAGLNVLGLSCLGTLEGLEKYALRFVAGFTGTVMFVGTALWLVPRLGVTAVVWAYLMQAASVLAVALVMCLTLTGAGLRTQSWRPLAILRELIAVGLPVRALGLVTLALDPLTRVAAAFYGGALAAGYYELASRFVMQLRMLLVAGFQSALPRLVKLRSVQSDVAASVEMDLFRGGVLLAFAAFTMAVLLSPIFYGFMLGSVPREAMVFFMLLSCGWCMNAISAPFYFSLLSRRSVSTIWMSSGLMATLNIPLAWWLGSQLGATGVVAALAMAVGAGSAFTIAACMRADGLTLRLLRPPELLVIAGSVAAVGLFLWDRRISGSGGGISITLLVVCFVYSAGFVLALRKSGIFQNEHRA